MRVVITGTSRGIGLELTKQALERGDHVLALARDPGGSAGLQKLAKEYPQLLSTAAIDVIDPELKPKLEAALKSWPHVDTLINNAGIFQQGTKREDFMKSFAVNSVAPFEIASAVLPWLKKSASARVVNVTSLMGSIDDNGSGGYYAYRASKSALNMINKSLSKDQPWLTTIVIHPGWVQTDMGGSGAPVGVPESAQGIWSVTQKLKPENSGQFFDFRGKQLPW
jgi:NAD(P)-dependent dehydrogenase (short-subunit alcohol dehydrogenase family)